MKVNINIDINVNEVWEEMTSAQRMNFLRWNLSDEGDISNIISECFNSSDIEEFVNKNIGLANDDELMDELIYRGYIVTKDE